MFISFEGIDGCGKSTQVTLLGARLEALGCRVTISREPGGTKLAEAVRALLLDAGGEVSRRAELLLFGASRAQHVEEIIRPALARGEWVLCDRFGDSSVAYQGGGLGLDAAFIAQMNAFATDELQPRVTFLFDLPPEAAAARLQAKGEAPDRIEARGAAFQSRVRAAYLQLAARDERLQVLDAAPPAKVVHERLVKALKQRGLWPVESANTPDLKLLRGGGATKNSLQQRSEQPPQSLESEQAVLGALLGDKAGGEALSSLAAENFYLEFHRRIFAVLQDLRGEGKAHDAEAVEQELSKRGQLEAVGGKAYLSALLEAHVSDSPNVEAHAREIKELSELRRTFEA